MPRLTSYIVILLALVTFAQAGPFGLSGGMTFQEIIKAGFKSDYESIRKISNTSFRSKFLFKLENFKDNVSPFSESSWRRTKVVHKDHPNKFFDITVRKDTGLSQFLVVIPLKDKLSVDFLADEYTKKIHSKYGGKIKREKEYLDELIEGDYIAFRR